MSANDLKDLVLKQDGITEKMYNVSKSILHKDMTINNYQKDKRFYWTLNKEEKGELANDKGNI